MVPESRNAHHSQLPNTPYSRTRPATRLGVSVANVVATIDVPSSHHGWPRLPRKNASKPPPAVRPAHRPTAR